MDVNIGIKSSNREQQSENAWSQLQPKGRSVAAEEAVKNGHLRRMTGGCAGLDEIGDKEQEGIACLSRFFLQLLNPNIC